MAFQISGPLRLLGYKDGKPVFDLPARPKPTEPTVTTTSAAPARTAPAPVRTAPARAAKPNLFGGTCHLCKNWVEANAGERGDKVDGKWQVRHKPGECPAKQEASEQTVGTRDWPRSRPLDLRTPDGGEALYGYFTAQWGEDTDDYVTIRIKRQKDDAKFKPGRLLVGYLHGRNNETDYTTFADIDPQGRAWIWKKYGDNTRLRQALAAVLGDQEAAGKAWAQASQKCWRCSIPLTTPESLARLMGDECASKYDR